MTDTVLEQLECYTIALTTDFGPGVPYHAIDHGDGHVNHGFRDLRGRPDRVESLHEAIGKPGLIELLKVINQRASCNVGWLRKWRLSREEPESGRPHLLHRKLYRHRISGLHFEYAERDG